MTLQSETGTYKCATVPILTCGASVAKNLTASTAHMLGLDKCEAWVLTHTYTHRDRKRDNLWFLVALVALLHHACILPIKK